MVLGPPGVNTDEPRLRLETFPSTTGFADAISVGDSGISITMLRPSGKARFEHQILDVISEGPFIAADANLEVIAVTGNRIVVREV